MYNITISSLDGNAKEKLEVTGSKHPDFSTVKSPKMHELKLEYEHIRDEQFYLRVGDEYAIHLILGDNTFSRVKTEEVIKGANGDPIAEGTTSGYIIHGGDQRSGTCMYMSDKKDCERLYGFDILGVEDRSENDPSEFHIILQKILELMHREGVKKQYHGYLAILSQRVMRFKVENVSRTLRENWKRILQ